MTVATILLVDDEPFNLDYLKQELENPGFELLTAANGQEALEKINRDSPDLVLLDIMMPVMDGFQVLANIKSNANLKDIPVIVISAMNDLDGVVKGIKMGAEDFLPKPFEPTLLHARVFACLEKKRLRDLEKHYLKSLQRELEIGREIQAGFLPSELPHANGWELAAHFRPAREVSGDFYDAFLLPNDRLVFSVGDVCGKGLGAALFMALFRSLIRATALNDLSCPSGGNGSFQGPERLQQIISFTNQYVCTTHPEAKFTTLFIALLDLKTGIFDYLNCGNEPPVLVGIGKKLVELFPNSPVIGVLPEAVYKSTTTRIDMGDYVIVFTDGITDALDEKGNSLERAGLLEVFSNTDTSNAHELLRSIVKKVEKHIGNADQFDDITLMVIKRSP